MTNVDLQSKSHKIVSTSSCLLTYCGTACHFLWWIQVKCIDKHLTLFQVKENLSTLMLSGSGSHDASIPYSILLTFFVCGQSNVTLTSYLYLFLFSLRKRERVGVKWRVVSRLLRIELKMAQLFFFWKKLIKAQKAKDWEHWHYKICRRSVFHLMCFIEQDVL